MLHSFNHHYYVHLDLYGSGNLFINLSALLLEMHRMSQRNQLLGNMKMKMFGHLIEAAKTIIYHAVNVQSMDPYL